MKNKYLIILLLFLPLIGCQPIDNDETGEDEVVLVRVDGEPITLAMLELMMRSRGVGEGEHEQMRELLEEMIRLRAAANAALGEGLADTAEVRAERRLSDIQVLARHYINHVQRENPVTDEEIEQLYAAQLERSGDTQYRIETIVFPDQAEVLRELAAIEEAGLDYDQVRDRAGQAGYRVEQPGWIDLSQVSEDVGAAMQGASAGELIGVPLQTPQGWHLLKVLETRELEAPSLDEVREGIARSLLRQRRQALMEALYEEASIEPVLPLEE